MTLLRLPLILLGSIVSLLLPLILLGSIVSLLRFRVVAKCVANTPRILLYTILLAGILLETGPITCCAFGIVFVALASLWKRQ